MVYVTTSYISDNCMFVTFAKIEIRLYFDPVKSY